MQKGLRTSSAIIALLIGILLLVANIAYRTQLVVATDPTLPPFEYIGGKEGDEIVGFDIDVAKHIAQNVRRRIKIEQIPFSATLSAVEDGTVDFVIAAIPITAERRERVDFSDPYYIATQVLVTRGADPVMRAVTELHDKHIGILGGTIGEIVITDLTVPTTTRLFPTSAELFGALINGYIDAIIIDHELAHYWQRTSTEALVVTDIQLETIQYGIAVQKGNDALLQIINRVLRDMRADETYDMLLGRHMAW